MIYFICHKLKLFPLQELIVHCHVALALTIFEHNKIHMQQCIVLTYLDLLKDTSKQHSRQNQTKQLGYASVNKNIIYQINVEMIKSAI